MLDRIKRFLRKTLGAGSAAGAVAPARPAELRTVTERNPPTPAEVRRGTLPDIDFIVTLVEDGAREVHFHPSFKDPRHQDSLRENLKFAIEQDKWMMPPRLVHEARLAVVDSGGAPVGFILTTETQPGSRDTSHEILMMAISSTARGRGLGGALLNGYIKGSPPNVAITARCYPASERMLSMLRQRGFVEQKLSPAGVRHMELPPRTR